MPLKDLKTIEFGNEADFKKAFGEITKLLGKDRVSTDKDILEIHSTSSFSTHQATPDQRPQLVVYPSTTEEVSKIMSICYKHSVPVVAFGGGTSLEGHFTPTRGGVSIDFYNMGEIISILDDDLQAVVQPNVGWEELNEELANHNLFFPPDPGPGAKIGGMVGTSCSGTNAFRFGTVKDWIISLKVVLADGTVIKTRQRPMKSSAGYNLTGLFIGAEGTLGLVTEITVKLTPKPDNVSVGVFSFKTIEDSAKAVAKVVQSGIKPNAMELMDDVAMKCVNHSGETSRIWPEEQTLLFKFSGFTPRDASEQLKAVERIARAEGCTSVQLAVTPEDVDDLWAARKHALWAVQAFGGMNKRVWTTDVAVPISKLPDLVKDTRKDLDDTGLFSAVLGHVGDGNFHAIIVYEPEKIAIATAAVERMVDRAIALGGTCTGEHGVGLGKRHHLDHELGPEAVNTMRKIKLALDPKCLLNTDKVIQVDPNDKTILEAN
ncbi:hypothetical protein CANCADRAFT_20771 [Tortispora caseinolytica NRRL Y-17796]|uniref:D-lactate dehydrogenase (cytochrome) n=1 Tax=Tortispora caseinolytica NRRL Y-17796 TaxID=767744 RepID=A0A1E4TLA1_9ASCO|nr:hypothetical protein CANCADRAFT_20771 [Tortispora caseinolytica NRRL Y-17796]